jgi:hypothetical protein
VRIFLTKWMARFVRRERLAYESLHEAIARAERGSIDADLGGGIIKQRVARAGKGRSGGFRTLIAYKRGGRAVFLYGFAKSERENIGQDELQTAREIGAIWLSADARQIARGIHEGELKEVTYGGEADQPSCEGTSRNR